MNGLLFLLMICPYTFLIGQNNGIFNGGQGTGYNFSYLYQLSNNSIYEGGSDDGYHLALFSQKTNLSIFSGGADDGYSFLPYSISQNSSIFNGGTEDGYSNVTHSITNGNAIFSGGIDDGYDLTIMSGVSGNEIYAGGKDDGYDVSEVSKLIWTGTQNEDWLMADNWNVKRIPSVDDQVIVPKGLTNYPKLSGKLLVGANGSYTYVCGSMILQYLSSVTGNSNAWLENHGLIEIYGLLEFIENPEHLILNLKPGLINIYSDGQFNIVK